MQEVISQGYAYFKNLNLILSDPEVCLFTVSHGFLKFESLCFH